MSTVTQGRLILAVASASLGLLVWGGVRNPSSMGFVDGLVPHVTWSLAGTLGLTLSYSWLALFLFLTRRLVARRAEGESSSTTTVGQGGQGGLSAAALALIVALVAVLWTFVAGGRTYSGELEGSVHSWSVWIAALIQIPALAFAVRDLRRMQRVLASATEGRLDQGQNRGAPR